MTAARVLTIPNLVSLVRLLTVPVFWWLAIGRDALGAAAIIAVVVGGTDWIDGYLARRLDQVTTVGAILDPLADRLMIASTVLVGLLTGAVPGILGGALVAREALVGGGALYLGRRGIRLDVRYLGKAATFLLYGAVPSFLLLADGAAPWLFTAPAWIGGVVGLVLYLWVGVEYLRDGRRALGATRGLAPRYGHHA